MLPFFFFRMHAIGDSWKTEGNVIKTLRLDRWANSADYFHFSCQKWRGSLPSSFSGRVAGETAIITGIGTNSASFESNTGEVVCMPRSRRETHRLEFAADNRSGVICNKKSWDPSPISPIKDQGAESCHPRELKSRVAMWSYSLDRKRSCLSFEPQWSCLPAVLRERKGCSPHRQGGLICSL